MNNTHIITFSIGDWSDDGHGKQEQFMIKSNIPVDVLREHYFEACKKLTVRLDGHEPPGEFPIPCKNYEDHKFPKKTYNHLKLQGVNMPNLDSDDDGDGEDKFDYYLPMPEQFFLVIMAVLKWKVPKFEYELIEGKTFHFYGHDGLGRHIGYFGYGLFD